MRAGHPAMIAITLVAAMTACAMAHAASTSPPSVPAVWTAHTILVRLSHLPKAYSCKELWYKFQAVLLSLGARADTVSVLTYDCPGPSPSVQLEFAFPHALPRSRERLADLQAAQRTVTLAPGQPAPLDAGDCQLVRQITAGFFTELPVRVLSSSLECGWRRAGQAAFRVSLQALESISSERQVANDSNSAAPVTAERNH
jgi:hypothetical protein